MASLAKRPENKNWKTELGGLLVALLIVVISEIVRFAPEFSESARTLGLGNYIGAMGSIGVLAVSVNLALPYLLSKLSGRFFPRFQLAILLVFAALFGALG